MLNIVLFCFGVIGITHIVVDSKIMAPIRTWFSEPYWPWERLQKFWSYMPFKKFQSWLGWLLMEYPIKFLHSMMTCYQCAGLWCGLLMSLIFEDVNLWQIFAAGGAGSFLSSLASTFLNYLEAATIINLED